MAGIGRRNGLQGMDKNYESVALATVRFWDTGGASPHIRYHQPGGVVRDSLGTDEPIHSGRWSVHWMKPEPMHAIEAVKSDPLRAGEPPLLRVEIKVGK
jgi:hypothetical protein